MSRLKNLLNVEYVPSHLEFFKKINSFIYSFYCHLESLILKMFQCNQNLFVKNHGMKNPKNPMQLYKSLFVYIPMLSLFMMGGLHALLYFYFKTITKQLFELSFLRIKSKFDEAYFDIIFSILGTGIIIVFSFVDSFFCFYKMIMTNSINQTMSYIFILNYSVSFLTLIYFMTFGENLPKINREESSFFIQKYLYRNIDIEESRE